MVLSYLGGDIERHPGPSRGAREANRDIDLLFADVMPLTAKRYENVLRKFEVWIWREFGFMLADVLEQGIVLCVSYARDFIRAAFRKKLLSSHDASTFCASIKRFLTFYQMQGIENHVDVQLLMKPLWKLRRSWFNEVPCDFRHPVNLEIALSLCV